MIETKTSGRWTIKSAGAFASALFLSMGLSWSAAAVSVDPIYDETDGNLTLNQGETVIVRRNEVALAVDAGTLISDDSTFKVAANVTAGSVLVDIIFDGCGVNCTDPLLLDAGFRDFKLQFDSGGWITITDSDGFLTMGNFVIALSSPTTFLEIMGEGFRNAGLDPTYRINITAVPLPAAALLFGSALLGGGLMRRRKMIKKFGLPA